MVLMSIRLSFRCITIHWCNA